MGKRFLTLFIALSIGGLIAACAPAINPPPETEPRPAASIPQPIPVIDPGGHKALIRDVTFTPDGRHLLSAGNDKTVRVWDLETGKTVRFIRGQIGPGHEGKIYAMALSPDGGMVAVGGYPSRLGIRLHDTADGRVLGLLKGHDNVIASLAFSPDGRWLASGQGGTWDPTVRIWDVRRQTQAHVLHGHKADIYALAFSPDGQRLVSGGYDHTLILWNAQTGERLATMTGHADKVRSVAYDPTGRYIASGSWDHIIRLWDGRTGTFIKKLADQGTQVSSMTFSPDGKRLLSGVEWGPNKDCHVWSVPDGKELLTFREHDDIVLAAAISPNGRLAATGGGNDRKILVWDLDTGRVTKRLAGSGGAVWAVGFSRSGDAIVWGQTSGYQHHNSRGPLEHTLAVRQGDEWELAPAGSAGDPSTHVRATDAHGPWRLEHRKGGDYGYDAILALFKDDKEMARVERDGASGYDHRSYTFTPDGQFVVSGGMGGVLTLFSVPDLTHVANFIGHEGDVWAVAPSPDGRFLVSGAADQTVRLWDLRAAERGGKVYPLLTLFPTKDGKEWLAWTPEGFYTGSSKEAARFMGYQINRGPDKAADYVRADQLYDKLYRPDLVAMKLQGGHDAEIRQALARIGDIRQVVAAGLPPVLEALNKGSVHLNGRTFHFRFKITDHGGGVGRIVYKVNGTTVRTLEGRAAGLTGERRSGEITRPVTLAHGRNVLTATAFNARGEIESRPIEVVVDVDDPMRHRPDLYLLCVGVTGYRDRALQLKYAAGDALELADALALRSRPLYRKVYTKTVIDREATADGIRAAFAKMAPKVRASDVFILYLSGHGVVLDGKYHFIPQDLAYENAAALREGSLSQDDLQALLAEIPALKSLMILDTCGAGAVAKTAGGTPLLASFRGVEEKMAIDKLMQATGRHILAATTYRQQALEGYKGHGVFTWALLEGMREMADREGNGNGATEIAELAEFVRREVPRITMEKWGYEQIPMRAIVGDPFPVGCREGYDKPGCLR